MIAGVVIDKQRCQSSGRCVRLAPDGFGLDADQLAEAKPDVAELPRERLIEIARSCPAFAIALIDADGNDLDPGDLAAS